MAKKTKDTSTKPKTFTEHRNNIKIIGENILYNNGIITAFYILPLVNYSTASAPGVESTIDGITNLIKNLCTTNPDLTFTIERIEKKVKVKDVLNNLYDTIRLYRPDYDMPIEFTKNLGDDVQSYCLLGIDIQQSNVAEVEDLTIKDTIIALSKQAANILAGLGNMKCDPEQILKIEENIYRTINYKCVRASKDLVFYNYVSKVFPTYVISYDKLSYINENSYEDIMGAIQMTISDNFGWFEMHNEGVEIFGLPSENTYGTMLEIDKFPSYIDNVNFPMDFPNAVTTIHCLRKEKANIDIKRIRAADRYTQIKQIEADEDIENVESTQEQIDIATRALQDIDDGEVICQFNTSILVTTQSKEDLKQDVMSIITQCKDRSILVKKSLEQGKTFLNNYINKKPQKYAHMANLKFPLSFQQNYGATVGDTFSKPGDIWSPSIGEDL